jgi:patatin-like phospholipase/acyl hydrolase
MGKYRILSMDGGGVRGLITVILLQRLSRRLGSDDWLYQQVDLLAGTSTGGLIALAIANGIPLQTIRELYETKSAQIFADSFLDNVKDVGKLFGAEHGNEFLRNELIALFGRLKLRDLPKSVLIPTFDLDNQKKSAEKRRWKPKLFNNIQDGDKARNELVYRVALYTSAAPTFLPVVAGYIDGGVYANNPSMCALAQSQDPHNVVPNPSLGEVVLLSIGTLSTNYIQGKNMDWGYAQWGRDDRLINLTLDGMTGIGKYQCEKILGEHTLRLEPKTDVRLDDYTRIEEMVQLANRFRIKDAVDWLETNWVA